MAYVIDQKSKTRPALAQEERYAYRFAGDRSSDSKRLDQPGQDFIAYSSTPDRLCFALCDGVSQSFLGDLGSRLIGEALIYWLENEYKVTETNQEIQLSLDRFLKSITSRASAQVANQVLPDHLPVLLREVLEEKRSLGSQSMFVAVRVDLPGNDYPRGRVICTWMGDSRIRIWGEKRERTDELRNDLQTAERWSTLTGPVNGLPHVFTDTLFGHHGKPNIPRLLAYSDGLAVLDTMADSLTNAQLDNIIDQLGEFPNSDDVSLFEFWLGRAPIGLDQPLEKPVLLPIEELTTEPDLPPFELVETFAPLSSNGLASGETLPAITRKRTKLSLIIWIPLIIIALGLIIWFGSSIMGGVWPENTTTPTSTGTPVPTSEPTRTASRTITPTSTSTRTLTLTPTPTPRPSSTSSATALITQTITAQVQPASVFPPMAITPTPTSTGN